MIDSWTLTWILIVSALMIIHSHPGHLSCLRVYSGTDGCATFDFLLSKFAPPQRITRPECYDLLFMDEHVATRNKCTRFCVSVLEFVREERDLHVQTTPLRAGECVSSTTCRVTAALLLYFSLCHLAVNFAML
eukprot:TRINITY_DN32405_c0_g1_i2.p2 TRINITY_DN32405_c0_g1~~TRINITY_DN32405_c0_g1_i2.p2  ORF type:complete len:133 (-),score=4.92 TRINITY_DN32405_c0_g1_i2:124-522(-)